MTVNVLSSEHAESVIAVSKSLEAVRGRAELPVKVYILLWFNYVRT